jgi:glycerol-3-phosphate acyltransferase PlsX
MKKDTKLQHHIEDHDENNHQNLIIAIDAMGGANAPFSTISGIKKAIKKHHDIHFLICGDVVMLSNLLKQHLIPEYAYTLVQTSSVVADTDKPTDALRHHKDSSMRVAINLVQDKKAIACVSSGNTGALMLTARMVLGSIADVKRPAIICPFPTIGKKTGRAVLLDMGANTECDEIALSQFAVMGTCFAKSVLKKDNPSVGILNIGTEHTKGRALERKTYEILSHSGLNFIGYIEGHDVISGKADIIVTDGFSGNIFLKSSEGAAKACLEQMRLAIQTNFITKVCGTILRPYLKKKMSFLDPRVNNGAMFIGIDGIVVKSHGSADDIAFANAIDVAIDLAKNNINENIVDNIHQLAQMEMSNISVGSEIIEKIKATSAKILGLGKTKG